MKDNIIIYVSSHNNYDMLEGEVLKNINREGFELINIDDKSCDEEIIKGKTICKKHNIVFLENKSRGVQMATQTLIDFINKNRPKCKWIFCFQHDNYPISTNFFTKISNYINNNQLNKFGILGFNVIDTGKWSSNSLDEFNNGKEPLGTLGLAHLSISNNYDRVLCTKRSKNLFKNPLWKKPHIIEIPMWAAVGLNVSLWNKSITPTDEYHFHLWLPDIAMQFNYNNYPCLILPDLYCLNKQELKSKYNIDVNSAKGAIKGNKYHFGEYSNFGAWKERWGWEYENVSNSFNPIQEKYIGTLIYDYFNHNINKGPLKTYDI